MNNTLTEMGYINPNKTNFSYIQNVCIISQNDIYLNDTMHPIFDLSMNFIFYIRYVPNNVILFIGQKWL
jgi:hypothetical protein